MEIIQKRKLYKELSKPEYNSGSGFYTEDLGEEMSLVHESIFGWWTPDFLYVLAKWDMGKSLQSILMCLQTECSMLT